ncbi:uncharacterized protein LOC102808689, partial [Saccoglossus kowalevskii]|uniref:Uncharacterized protein LOC102808689 n=1 Tax=Saccoglossus kowalevskii TaxID=10224 RepID=A0ABM0LW54_SACKO
MRFRANNIAVCSDIEKAFLNVRLHPDERKFTKFLWLTDVNNIDSPLKVYQFKSVLFGAVCSPFILNAVIKTHLDNNCDINTANQMKDNIYVDNVIDGVYSEADTVKYYSESTSLMNSCGFNLRAWSSNSPDLCELATRDNKYEPADEVSVL